MISRQFDARLQSAITSAWLIGWLSSHAKVLHRPASSWLYTVVCASNVWGLPPQVPVRAEKFAVMVLVMICYPYLGSEPLLGWIRWTAFLPSM